MGKDLEMMRRNKRKETSVNAFLMSGQWWRCCSSPAITASWCWDTCVCLSEDGVNISVSTQRQHLQRWRLFGWLVVQSVWGGCGFILQQQLNQHGRIHGNMDLKCIYTGLVEATEAGPVSNPRPSRILILSLRGLLRWGAWLFNPLKALCSCAISTLKEAEAVKPPLLLRTSWPLRWTTPSCSPRWSRWRPGRWRWWRRRRSRPTRLLWPR